MTTVNDPVATPGAPQPTLSVWRRAVAVFARPAEAWIGLERRAQWWFPLLVAVLVSVAGTLVVYQRAIVPSQLEQFERQVEAGQLPAEAMARIEEQVASPVSMGFALGAIVIAVPVMTCVFALLPWISAGFLLGRRFRYRDAFAVTAWAGLVAIPAQILSYLLGWINESMSGVHTGFGVLLPLEDPPSKLMAGLGVFLDQGIGPLALWYVLVVALGAAAVTGGDRRRVVVTVGAVWLVVMAVVSVVAGLVAPGA
jgi:hypothetical protein